MSTSNATTENKRVTVQNLWNQVVSIVTTSGNEIQLKAKSSIDLEPGDVSALMNTLQRRGVIRIKPVS